MIIDTDTKNLIAEMADSAADHLRIATCLIEGKVARAEDLTHERLKRMLNDPDLCAMIDLNLDGFHGPVLLLEIKSAAHEAIVRLIHA